MPYFASVRLVCALLCASALPAHAAVLHVAPSGSDNNSGTAAAPYATLQAAVNNAKAGDTITLAAGTYAGSGNRDIDFGGKALSVKSAGGAGQTTIDCGGSIKENHRGFNIHGNVSGARIEGLTIKKGFPNNDQTFLSGENQGAGAFIERGCQAAFVSCVFTNNGGVNNTGGAIQSYGRLTLAGCTFDGNPSSGLRNLGTATVTGCKFSNNTSKAGAGIMSGAGLLTLTDSTFTDNTCDGVGGAGGGLDVEFDLGSGFRATVARCTFSGNQAHDGGAVNAHNVTLTDCTFSGNTAIAAGGGFYLSNGHGALLRCVFQGNKAGRGGAILADEYSHLALTSCVFAGNSVGDGNGGAVSSKSELMARFCSFSSNEASGADGLGGAIANSGKASLTDCILWGDTAQNGGEISEATSGSPTLSAAHCDIKGGQSGPGNMKSDPHFVSATDLHLGTGSPCRHAGASVPGVTTDAGKKPRSSPPSIGAYE